MADMTTAPQEAWVPTDTFGTRLLLIRRELGMTVKQAAERSGIHYATWSTWENGSKPADLVRVVTTISDTLGVDRDWLMWGTAQNAPRPDGPEGDGADDRARTGNILLGMSRDDVYDLSLAA